MRGTAEETVFSLCCKNKGSFIRDENIFLEKAVRNTVGIIWKYFIFLQYHIYLKENVAIFPLIFYYVELIFINKNV